MGYRDAFLENILGHKRGTFQGSIGKTNNRFLIKQWPIRLFKVMENGMHVALIRATKWDTSCTFQVVDESLYSSDKMKCPKP